MRCCISTKNYKYVILLIWTLLLALFIPGCSEDQAKEVQMPEIKETDVQSISLVGHGLTVTCSEKDIASVVDFLNQAVYTKIDWGTTKSTTQPPGAISVTVTLTYKNGKTEIRTFSWQKIEGSFYEAKVALTFFDPFFGF